MVSLTSRTVTQQLGIETISNISFRQLALDLPQKISQFPPIGLLYALRSLFFVRNVAKSKSFPIWTSYVVVVSLNKDGIRDTRIKDPTNYLSTHVQADTIKESPLALFGSYTRVDASLADNEQGGNLIFHDILPAKVSFDGNHGTLSVAGSEHVKEGDKIHFNTDGFNGVKPNIRIVYAMLLPNSSSPRIELRLADLGDIANAIVFPKQDWQMITEFTNLSRNAASKIANGLAWV